MRNRTKMVTNQLGSDFEENDADFDGGDDSDDWKPEPEPGTARESPAKRKATATKTSAKKTKKIKKEEVKSEDDESDDGSADFEEDDEGSMTKEGKKSLDSDARNIPDRQGIFTLYAYKGDLKNGLRANKNICLWRRDGQSLLQKYLRDKDTSTGSVHFNSSMVYSCWEDRRKNEFLELKVRCVPTTGKESNPRDAKVELLNVDEIEATCINEKYAELDLEPYVSYADKKKEEDSMNGSSTNVQQTEEEDQETEEEVSEGEE